MDNLDEIVAGFFPEESAGRTYHPRVCACCGEEYIPTGPRQKLCSECGKSAKKDAAAKPIKASSTDDAVPTDAAPAEDTALTEDTDVPDAEAVFERAMCAEGIACRIPAPDPIADIVTAHRHLSDIAERWNVNMPDLLDYVGQLDTIARVMTKKNQPERT